MTRVDCDECLNGAQLLRDGTVGSHYRIQRGVREKCEGAGRRYAPHLGYFKVIKRGTGRAADLWHCQCRCGQQKVAATYDELEVWHNAHGRAQDGAA